MAQKRPQPERQDDKQDGKMLDLPRRTTEESPLLPANPPAELRRRSAVEVIQSIRTYLEQATEITIVDEEDSNIHFDTPCGYCLFRPDRHCWHIRHRPFGTRPNDVGVLGGDCASPTTIHATASVARLTGRSEKRRPPKKLVQLLLRRAELRNMLQQVNLPDILGNVSLPCRTNEEWDLTPVLQTVCGDLSPSRPCVRKVLDLAVKSCSSWLEESFKGWTVELESSRTPKENEDGHFKAVQQLINACVAPCVIENTSPSGENTRPRRETSYTTAKRRKTVPSVGTADNGENVQSEGNQPASVTLPGTRPGFSRASCAVIISDQQIGYSDDDKAACMQPTRPAKSAKQCAVSNAKNPPLAVPKTAGRSGTSVHPSGTLKMTTREKGSFGDGSPANTSSVTDARVDHSGSKAQPKSRTRTRKTAREEMLTENPRVAKKVKASEAPVSAGSTMCLRKRCTTSIIGNDTNPPGYATRSSTASDTVHIPSELRRGIDVGECEVCLQPYALSYLTKHRSKVHGLAHKTFGCPYCPETYWTYTDRLNHIQRAHPGQPSKWAIEGCDNLSKVKVHMYSCPLCPGQLTHSGLACHLGSSHQTSIDAFPDAIFCTCPFCWSSTGDGKQLACYKSLEDLRTHISTKHKGCFLLDDIKIPVEPTARRQDASVKNHPTPPQVIKKKSQRRVQCKLFVQEKEREVYDATSFDEEGQHWVKLDHTGLTADYAYGDFVSVTFGNTLDSAIEAVDAQLGILESNVANDDYAAEMKLYNKGMKDRQQNSDAERIEKERHKEEVERKILQVQYENRHKKKRSQEDIEFDAFLARPIYFAPRESPRKSTCPRGKECDLCVSAEQPETNAPNRFIDAPSFVVKAVTDSSDNVTELECNPAEKKQGTSSRTRGRRGRNSNRTARSVLMLHEMKHSLRFIQSYNEGYFVR